MDVLIQGFTFLLGGIQVMIQQAIVLRVAKVRHPVIRLLISIILLMTVHGTINRFIYNLGLGSMAIWVLLLILSYRFIFEQTVWASILMGIGQMALASCIEYVAQLLMMPLDSIIQQYEYWGQVVIRIIILGMLLLTYFAIRTFNIRMLPSSIKKESRYLWIIYLIYLLLFSVPNLIMIERNQQVLSNSIEIYNIVLFIVFFIYNIIYVRSLSKASNITQQLEVQRLYAGTLETLLEELRGFKHDFANIISPIVEYIESGDWEKLKDLSEKLTKEFLKINTTDIVNTQLKEIPHLYIMMLSKIHKAEAINVDFHVSVQGKLDLKYCDTLDFCRIIGNLLDNALDAATASKQKLVEMEVLNRQDRNWITIKNYYSGDVDRNRIFQSGYTTKQNHTGFGLSQTISIIEKYRKHDYAMELRTHCYGQEFTQTLVI